MSEDSSRAPWLQQARSYLRNADPVLARLIDDRPAFDPRAWLAQLPPMDLYGALLDMNGGGCTHLDRIHDVTPSSWGCEDCLAQGRRDWVHLRVCQECGHVGCCDNSPGRHATAHFRSAGHPVIRSYEPGEDWYWCYVDQFAFELEGAPPAPSHP